MRAALGTDRFVLKKAVCQIRPRKIRPFSSNIVCAYKNGSRREVPEKDEILPTDNKILPTEDESADRFPFSNYKQLLFSKKV